MPSSCSNPKPFSNCTYLLILSIVFILLNLPYHIFIIHYFLGHLIRVGVTEPQNKMAWHVLFQLFYFLNFAINFFIYSACGQQFRVGLKRLVKKARRKVFNVLKEFFKKSENNIHIRHITLASMVLNYINMKVEISKHKSQLAKGNYTKWS